MEKVKVQNGKNIAFTYAKIFVDFFANDEEKAIENFMKKYNIEISRYNKQTKKYFIDYLESWNFHRCANLFENILKRRCLI